MNETSYDCDEKRSPNHIKPENEKPIYKHLIFHGIFTKQNEQYVIETETSREGEAGKTYKKGNDTFKVDSTKKRTFKIPIPNSEFNKEDKEDKEDKACKNKLHDLMKEIMLTLSQIFIPSMQYYGPIDKSEEKERVIIYIEEEKITNEEGNRKEPRHTDNKVQISALVISTVFNILKYFVPGGEILDIIAIVGLVISINAGISGIRRSKYCIAKAPGKGNSSIDIPKHRVRLIFDVLILSVNIAILGIKSFIMSGLLSSISILGMDLSVFVSICTIGFIACTAAAGLVGMCLKNKKARNVCIEASGDLQQLPDTLKRDYLALENRAEGNDLMDCEKSGKKKRIYYLDFGPKMLLGPANVILAIKLVDPHTLLIAAIFTAIAVVCIVSALLFSKIWFAWRTHGNSKNELSGKELTKNAKRTANITEDLFQCKESTKKSRPASENEFQLVQSIQSLDRIQDWRKRTQDFTIINEEDHRQVNYNRIEKDFLAALENIQPGNMIFKKHILEKDDAGNVLCFEVEAKVPDKSLKKHALSHNGVFSSASDDDLKSDEKQPLLEGHSHGILF